MTDQDQRNIELTKALYAATGNGDWQAAEAMLTDDFFVSEASTLPFAGVYRGKQGLREVFGKVMGMIDATGFDIHAMTAGDGWVAVFLDIVTRDADGAELRLPLIEAMRFRDGQVCEIKPYYFDTSLVLKATEAKAGAPLPVGGGA